MRFVGIDPSSKTGLVVLDKAGDVLRAKELNGIGTKDPLRMVTLIDEILDYVQPMDKIAIEGFAFGAQGQGVAFQYGLGHGIRMALHRRGFTYTEVSPAAVKKYATGKGNTKKDEMVLPIFKRWGFEHNSDNVRDAYVIARIIHQIHNQQSSITDFQQDVIEAILNPKTKKTRKRLDK